MGRTCSVQSRWWLIAILATTCLAGAGRSILAAPSAAYDCYEPIPGGWRIRVTADPKAPRPEPNSQIGVVATSPSDKGNPRLHRRPLYPPADRSLIFTAEQLTAIERCGFRPLVLAYIEPRFLFDFHSAGGLLGHLHIGLATPEGPAKWLHQWSELEVSYVDGRMEYVIRDPAFPGVTVALEAIPLANSAGLLAKVGVQGLKGPASLVWAYGGASAFFTNWAMTSPEFNYDPKQCAKDAIRWQDGRFTLTRGFDKSDAIMNEVFAVAAKLPGWKAVIQAGSSFKGRSGFGTPAAFAASPSDLVRSAGWNETAEQTNVVAVQEIPLPPSDAAGFIAVGMGGDIVEVIRHLEQAWKAARARNAAIAGRVETQTPDPYLDAAMPMMAFATEGTWGDSAIVHGGWSWRFAYLGWRTWYGPNAYGWTDRIAKAIRNHIRLNRVMQGPDEGALGSLLEYSPGVYYNMNEVFLDHVRHYFDYTNDLELMREIYPALQGIVKWEDRRLRPVEEPLYENALNTWISDQHWYIRGQCTQASAYMLRANTLLADLSRRLGHDPAAYERQAAAIRQAMQEKLWMPRAGVFAEYQDTLGARLLHPEPELPTIYHSAEFGSADGLQIWQMLHWADTHLRSERTPGGGRLYWSSNWFPNMARSYTHSTYEMAYAEELSFALTNCLAGRSDEAYAIERACLAGIFNGPTPGGLACHSYIDGRQRANDEFADGISMWGRTIVEGLFGIMPKRPDGIVELSPQLPSSWPEASIAAPHFAYRWKHDGHRIAITWTSPVETAVRMRLPLLATAITSVLVDGQTTAHVVEAGVDLTWVIVKAPRGRQGTIEVAYEPRGSSAPTEIAVKQDETFSVQVEGSTVLDPQGVLAAADLKDGTLTGRIVCEPGPAVLFVSAGTKACPYHVPIRIRVEPRSPTPAKAWIPPQVPDRDLSRWLLVDLTRTYNASVTDAMRLVAEAVKPPPPPASEVNTGYYKYHLVPLFVSPPVSDEAWRKKVGSDGVAWTTDGIPFKSARQGPNIGVVTRVAVFPQSLELPVNGQGRTLYLMLSGTTFAMQSHVVNLRLTLRYANGTSEAFDLVNPMGIGDCWNQYRFHDTAANGFENLGGRSGPAGSSQVKDLTVPVVVDTEAHLVAFDLKPGAVLQSVRLEAVANDMIFGVMGATILK